MHSSFPTQETKSDDKFKINLFHCDQKEGNYKCCMTNLNE